MTIPNETPKQPKVRVLEYTDEQHAEDFSGLKLNPQGYKYRVLDGRVMPPYVTPARYALSRRLETTDSDICFISYPKSGSTWLSYILLLLTENSNDNNDNDNDSSKKRDTTLRDSLHWVESSWTYPRSEEDLKHAPTPRIFKSHMPYDMGLGGIPANNKCRYIYIARNPKDVVTSYFHFEARKSWAGYYTGDWEDWFRLWVDGKVQRGDWFDHVLSWWERRDCENILFLKYEDLKKDTDREMRKIAAFLGLEVTPEKLALVREKVGFETMKKDDVLGDVKEFNQFFRKGKVGSWKEQFTVAQNEFFDQLCEERFRGTGLTFDGLN